MAIMMMIPRSRCFLPAGTVASSSLLLFLLLMVVMIPSNVKSDESPRRRRPPIIINNEHEEQISHTTTNNNNTINFCAIGDWGGKEFFPYYTKAQKETADNGLTKIVSKLKSQFIIALGDNFYHQGVTKSTSHRFDWTYENVYNSPSLIDIPWYVIGGNHDHYGNITAQIEYTKIQHHHQKNNNNKKDKKDDKYHRWKFPSLYHSHSFKSEDGSVTLDLILIDTVELCGMNEVQIETEPGYFDPLPLKEKDDVNKEQWDWIENQLKSSTADYLLVGGHYPIYSVCKHGPTETLIKHLRPLLIENGAHYLSGHDHCMIHFEEETKKKKNLKPAGDNDIVVEEEEEDDFVVKTHHILTGMGDGCCYEATNMDNHKLNPPPGALKWFISHENQDLYKAIGGFTSFQLNPNQMTIQYHDHQGHVLFTADPILPREKENE